MTESERLFRAKGALGFDADAAARALAASDARMAELIARVGPCRLALDEARSTFEALAEAIVYQQLTGKAAATIFGRVRDAFAERGRLRPDAIAAATDERLRACGLSRAKTAALRDLAAKSQDGVVPALGALAKLDDDAIVERLTQVRGIGRWTVEMLLIFRLGRPDVLPVDDYGVRKGFALVYRKRELPKPRDLARFGERWKPHRTVASWYLWRALEHASSAGRRANAKKKKEKKNEPPRRQDAKSTLASWRLGGSFVVRSRATMMKVMLMDAAPSA